MIKKIAVFLSLFSFIILINLSCATKTKQLSISSSTLNGKTFQLINMFEGRGITISFHNGEFYGYGGFNTYLGKYEIRRGNMIVLRDMSLTTMGGTSEVVEEEKQYIDILNKASSIELTANSLTITTLDEEKLIFKRIK